MLPSQMGTAQLPKMSTEYRNFILARTSPGEKRSALPAKTQGGSVKSAMGGMVTLRVGSVNVGTMRGREGEVVEMAASRHLDFWVSSRKRLVVEGRGVRAGVERHGNSV